MILRSPNKQSLSRFPLCVICLFDFASLQQEEHLNSLPQNRRMFKSSLTRTDGRWSSKWRNQSCKWEIWEQKKKNVLLSSGNSLICIFLLPSTHKKCNVDTHNIGQSRGPKSSSIRSSEQTCWCQGSEVGAAGSRNRKSAVTSCVS